MSCPRRTNRTSNSSREQRTPGNCSTWSNLLLRRRPRNVPRGTFLVSELGCELFYVEHFSTFHVEQNGERCADCSSWNIVALEPEKNRCQGDLLEVQWMAELAFARNLRGLCLGEFAKRMSIAIVLFCSAAWGCGAFGGVALRTNLVRRFGLWWFPPFPRSSERTGPGIWHLGGLGFVCATTKIGLQACALIEQTRSMRRLRPELV